MHGGVEGHGHGIPCVSLAPGYVDVPPVHRGWHWSGCQISPTLHHWLGAVTGGDGCLPPLTFYNIFHLF